MLTIFGTPFGDYHPTDIPRDLLKRYVKAMRRDDTNPAAEIVEWARLQWEDDTPAYALRMSSRGAA